MGFSKNVCENNAILENVNAQITFQQASASNLPFDDEVFDAAVSNLVFHEVKDQKDKMALIKEAFRVVKKGGSFAFQDLFLLKRLYGSSEELVKTIQSWGITKVEFKLTRDEPFISTALQLPSILGAMGLIKGGK